MNKSSTFVTDKDATPLTVEEAGEFLGRSTWGVRELIYKGELPFVKVGKRVHLDITDLEDFISNNKKRFIDKDLVNLN